LKFPFNRHEFYWNNARHLVFCDFETSGLIGITHSVISGSFRITDKELNVIEDLDFKMKPYTKNWDKGAEKIHGFKEHQAMLFEDPKECYTRIIDYFERNNIENDIFVCHALNTGTGLFDSHQMMAMTLFFSDHHEYHKRFTASITTMDYLKEGVRAGHFLPIINDKPDKNGKIRRRQIYGLGEWCSALGIPLDHHNAKSDMLACFEIYKRCHEL